MGEGVFSKIVEIQTCVEKFFLIWLDPPSFWKIEVSHGDSLKSVEFFLRRFIERFRLGRTNIQGIPIFLTLTQQSFQAQQNGGEKSF